MNGEEEDFLEDDEQQQESAAEPEKKAAAAEPEKPPTAAELAELKKENARLNARVNEEAENSRFWHDRAKSTPAKAATAKAEEAPKLSEDAVDAISSGDPKRIKALLSGLGFVERTEVTREIQATKNEVVSESALLNQYPDLNDQTSEFFKATARHFNDLKQDPDMAKSPRIMQVAAKLANSELNGGNAKRQQVETSEERAERVGRQSGERSRRPSTNRGAGADDATQNELSAGQKDIIARFRAAGADITEEGYKKRASNGVRMGGAPSRRGR